VVQGAVVAWVIHQMCLGRRPYAPIGGRLD
jgi:hypothetical protein